MDLRFRSWQVASIFTAFAVGFVDMIIVLVNLKTGRSLYLEIVVPPILFAALAMSTFVYLIAESVIRSRQIKNRVERKRALWQSFRSQVIALRVKSDTTFEYASARRLFVVDPEGVFTRVCDTTFNYFARGQLINATYYQEYELNLVEVSKLFSIEKTPNRFYFVFDGERYAYIAKNTGDFVLLRDCSRINVYEHVRMHV